MNRQRGGVWSGLLLLLIGIWLVMQTVIGDLPGRLLSWTGIGGNDS
jgi:hypothetical protein